MQNTDYQRMRLSPPLTGLVSGLMLAISPGALPAAELAEPAIRTAVETWVRHVTAEARADARIETMEPHTANGRTFAYVAKLAGGGYCLCGADDRLLPVYLYSPRGSFDATDPNSQDILAEIQWRLARLQKALDQQDPILKNYAPELSRRALSWQELTSAKASSTTVARPKDGGPPSTVVLPLASRWHQNSPYNDACPNLTPGQDEHAIVGCVATAMSQLMYYWKWPPAGTGAVPTPLPYFCRYTTTWLTEPLTIDPGVPASWGSRLVWTSDSGGTLSMNGYWDEQSVYFSATQITNNAAYLSALSALWARMTPAQFVPNVTFSTPINWSAIRDVHTDPVDDGDREVAALCYATGVSVYMHYGLWFSSAGDSHIAEALKSYFYYDPAAVCEWADAARITDEIQWFRPAEIGGGGPPPIAGGHAWVAYGYNTTTTPTQFLMNLGWPGQPPAWYSLDQVFPIKQDMTTRIAPLNAVKFVGANTAGNGSPNTPYLGIEQALANVSDGTTLIFKAGSNNTFGAPTLTLNRPLILKGVNATIRPL
ncbi:MAG TPA: C10 family peptidase [Verrucomicrobiae bacterium]